MQRNKELKLFLLKQSLETDIEGLIVAFDKEHFEITESYFKS